MDTRDEPAMTASVELDHGCNFREKAIEGIFVDAIRASPPYDWIIPVIGVIGRPVSKLIRRKCLQKTAAACRFENAAIPNNFDEHAPLGAVRLDHLTDAFL
jgi:hypothetical protein